MADEFKLDDGTLPKAVIEATTGLVPIWHIDVESLSKAEEKLVKAIIDLIGEKVASGNYGKNKSLYRNDALSIVDAIEDMCSSYYSGLD